jgi:predicted hydrocarbon binding protein
MIGDYKGFVKNKVVVALLQAYHDILDYDGMKSILKEAGMMHIKDIRDKNPNATLDFFSFKKIISAQNCLLFDSSNLLYEIGKKFSFYLFPFGKSFEEIIHEINSSIDTDWKVSIIENNENEIIVRVERCIFCSEIGVPCDLFKGFLFNSLQKSLPSEHRVVHDRVINNTNDPSHNNFIVKLKIDKSIK